MGLDGVQLDRQIAQWLKLVPSWKLDQVFTNVQQYKPTHPRGYIDVSVFSEHTEFAQNITNSHGNNRDFRFASQAAADYLRTMRSMSDSDAHAQSTPFGETNSPTTAEPPATPQVKQAAEKPIFDRGEEFMDGAYKYVLSAGGVPVPAALATEECDRHLSGSDLEGAIRSIHRQVYELSYPMQCQARRLFEQHLLTIWTFRCCYRRAPP